MNTKKFSPIRLSAALKPNLIKAFEEVNSYLFARGDNHPSELFTQTSRQTAEGEEELIFHVDDNLGVYKPIYYALRDNGVHVADVEDDGSEIILCDDPRLNTLFDANSATQIVEDHPYIDEAVIIANPRTFHFILA